MDENPKVSILIPAKNEAIFIKECLQSIQNQTYKNWETIVINDHSTDHTADLVHQFAERDARIKIKINKGIGIIPALQTAYELSEGTYITRMDADDIMRPRKIEALLSGLLKQGEKHVAVGGVHYFAERNLKSGFKNYQEWLNEHTRNGTNFSDIFKECTIPSPCWMLARKDLDGINAFNENRYPEDYDLAFRMYGEGYKVVATNEIIHDWRDYETRTSRTSAHYKDYTFTAIKWYYFNALHHQKEKTLVVLGTGYRGKLLAQHLMEQQVDFIWFSNNKEKIGKHIYGNMIYAFDATFEGRNKQLISTVANREGKDFIEKVLINNNGNSKNLIHFC